MKNLILFACTHTNTINDEFNNQLNINPYLYPLLCGANISKYTREQLPIINNKQWFVDNDGTDNISDLNLIINEITGIYWVYKNLDKFKDKEYIGFCHYRRFFNISDIETYVTNDLDLLGTSIDVTHSILINYLLCHPSYDIFKYLTVLNERDLYIYLNHFSTTLNMFIPYNMFICKKELFKQYAEFLFAYLPMLVNVKNSIDMSNYDNYQKRSLGFFLERLTSYFFFYNFYYNKTYINYKKTDIIRDNYF